MTLAENNMVDLIAGLLAAVGAINWGLDEFIDYNVLTDLLALSSGTTEYEVVVGVIALAGVFLLYSSLYFNTEVDL